MAKRKVLAGIEEAEEPVIEFEPENIRYVEPRKMTLYQAYKRQAFCPGDADENLRIYNKKRRGYEGKERTVIVDIDS